MAARSFLINNTAMSKLLTPNVYCWCCETLVTIHRTHLSENGMCAELVYTHRKRIRECAIPYWMLLSATSLYLICTKLQFIHTLTVNVCINCSFVHIVHVADKSIQ